MNDSIQLTQYSKSSGCGCKIAPAVLHEMLGNNKNTTTNDFPNLLIGNETNDDACVYDLGDGTSIISTTDFFMPIVDDPYTFGQVAAANALSDVYAMGGKPLFATAILGWPIDKIDIAYAAEVMRGARDICHSIDIPIAGGHSIESSEPIFGLNVTGRAPIDNIKANNNAQVGDILLLTKPIGSGILSAAMKRGKILEDDVQEWISHLVQVNSVGEALGKIKGVNAMTDITGFGLLGHLIEMCQGSKVNAVIDYNAIPKMKNINHYIAQFIMPDATYRNWNAYKDLIHLDPTVSMQEAFALLPDPQTNGGLLIAVKPDSLEEVRKILDCYGVLSSHSIGICTEPKEDKIVSFE